MFKNAKQVFSLRKLTIGLVSACVSLAFLAANQTVHADELTDKDVNSTNFTNSTLTQTVETPISDDTKFNNVTINTNHDNSLDSENSSYTIKTEQRPFDSETHQIVNPELSSQLNLAINQDLAQKIVLPIELEHTQIPESDLTVDSKKIANNALFVNTEVTNNTDKHAIQQVPVSQTKSVLNQVQPVQSLIQTNHNITAVDMTLSRQQAISLAQELLQNTDVAPSVQENRELNSQVQNSASKMHIMPSEADKNNAKHNYTKSIENRVTEANKPANAHQIKQANNDLQHNIREEHVNKHNKPANKKITKPVSLVEANVVYKPHQYMQPKTKDDSKVQFDLDWHVANFKSYYHVNNYLGLDGFNLPKVGRYRLQLIKHDTNAFKVSFAYISDTIIDKKIHVFNISQQTKGYLLKVSEVDIAHRILKPVQQYNVKTFKQLNQIINRYVSK